MGDPTVEQIVSELVSGEGDPSSVPLSLAAGVAEALGDAEAVEPLAVLAERVLPRLVKKERFDEVEEIWLACCAAGAMPVEVMLKAADRLAARGRGDQAREHVVMLVESLAGADRAGEALRAAVEGLAVTPSRELVVAALPALEALHPEAANLDDVRARLRGGGDGAAPEELQAADRALRYAPGSFVQWEDHTLARVAACDGVEARVLHPSGAEEIRRVDGQPPPRVLGQEAHEVRRLFDLDGLRASWLEDPVPVLSALLAEHDGYLTTTSLKGILVPRFVDESAFDGVLAKIKAGCAASDGSSVPSYDTKRRIFVAPGAEAPRPKRKPSRPAAPKEEQAPARPRPAAAPSGPAVALEQPRWVDLTALAEIRSLLAGIEGEVGELTRELTVDLPVRLEEARAHGDLRENAEYDAAKERLAFVQARIEQLRGRLGALHELSRVRLVPGKVTVMSRVTVADEGTGAERILRVTPAELPEPQPGDVSAGTPYAKALLGKEVGDVAVVRLPRRTERLEIVRIEDPDEA